MKKVLILNDGSNYENWGIKACIDGVKEIFKSDSVEGIPHSYMHKRYSLDPKFMGRKVLNENSRLAKKILKPYHLLPRVADEYEYIANLWINGDGGSGAKDFLQKANKADVIIFNAEGSTYRDNIGAMKGLFMLWFAKTKLGKEAYFINGSVTLTAVDSILPAMIRKVFSVIDGVSVRENESKKNIESFYPKLKNINVVPDSVFALDFLNKTKKDSESLGDDYFCFSLSMLPMDYMVSRDRSALVALINELKRYVKTPVLLAKDVEDQILKDLAKETGAKFIGADYDYQEIMGLLKNAKFLISGRYHHLIFASKVGCPLIALNTSSHKITGLCQFFGECVKAPYDPTDLWSLKDAILEDVERILSDKSLKSSIANISNALSIKSYGHKMY